MSINFFDLFEGLWLVMSSPGSIFMMVVLAVLSFYFSYKSQQDREQESKKFSGNHRPAKRGGKRKK